MEAAVLEEVNKHIALVNAEIARERYGIHILPDNSCIAVIDRDKFVIVQPDAGGLKMSYIEDKTEKGYWQNLFGIITQEEFEAITKVENSSAVKKRIYQMLDKEVKSGELQI